MPSQSFEQFIVELYDYCGQSLQAVAVHSDADSRIAYLRPGLTDDATVSMDLIETWVQPPSGVKNSPQAIVTVREHATSVHLAIDSETILSIVLEKSATGQLNAFVEWCNTVIHNTI